MNQKKLLKQLIRHKKTIALAESCTGGLISKLITDIPGASEIFKGAIVAYSNESKTRLLGVKPKTLFEKGAVSAQTAREMALGALRLFNSDFACSVSGIAGPGGATPEKPVGLVYVGLASARTTKTYRFHFKGARSLIRKKAAEKVLKILNECLRSARA